MSVKKKKVIREQSTIISNGGKAYDYKSSDWKGVLPFYRLGTLSIGHHSAYATKHNGTYDIIVAESGMCITKNGAKRKVLRGNCKV